MIKIAPYLIVYRIKNYIKSGDLNTIANYIYNKPLDECINLEELKEEIKNNNLINGKKSKEDIVIMNIIRLDTL